MRAPLLAPLLVPLLIGACAPTPPKPRGIFDLSSKPELSKPPSDVAQPSTAASGNHGISGPTTSFGAGGTRPGGF